MVNPKSMIVAWRSVRVILSNPGQGELATTASRFRCVPSMFDSLGVKVPYPT